VEKMLEYATVDEKSAGNFLNENLPSDPEHKDSLLIQQEEAIMDCPNVTRLLFKKIANLPTPLPAPIQLSSLPCIFYSHACNT
jgi:hypothetical protein